MAQYTINDFKKGDKVYHQSNRRPIMVVIEIKESLNEILCRWIDQKGNTQTNEFMPEELGKWDDIKLNIF